MRFATSTAFLFALSSVAFADDPAPVKPAEKKPAVRTIPAIRINGAAPAKKSDKPAPPSTHEQVKEIAVKGETSGYTLQTLCVDGEGNVVGLVSTGRYGAKPKSGSSEIQIFAPDGHVVRHWKLDFLGQAVNCGPDGSLYVAGDGRIAKYDKAGKLIVEADLPQVAELLKNNEKLREQAKEQLAAEIQSFEGIVKQFKQQKEALTKKDTEDKITQQEKTRLRALEQNLKTYEKLVEEKKKTNIDAVVKNLSAGLRSINAVAVTDKDVYVVCGETKGHGYAVWRMNHQFHEPIQVMSGLRGCCGQMDIQARGDELFIAENCSHAVGKYDRDGKKIATFGKRGQNLEVDSFGGCCNPMNVRIAPDGSCYTAESEGFVKLFNPKGEFVALVGTAKLAGGCKNVAVAASPDGEYVYFCDQPGSRILVLQRKPGKASE